MGNGQWFGLDGNGSGCFLTAVCTTKKWAGYPPAHFQMAFSIAQ